MLCQSFSVREIKFRLILLLLVNMLVLVLDMYLLLYVTLIEHRLRFLSE